jgi:hypothetical protein
MTICEAAWKAPDEPLGWWVYASVFIAATLGDFVHCGATWPGEVRACLVSPVALGVICSVRRVIVGHWR